MSELYDVVKVDQNTLKVKVVAERKTIKNAEAIENFAVMQNGVDTHFFVTVRHMTFKDGDEYYVDD